tara:strand:+ start:15593 stop:16150 length:558 start_codon:yes stop_codon:yes gene_type:complete
VKSSYKENNYGNVFRALAHTIRPKKVVEFGILEAYSLTTWVGVCPSSTEILAYDIFEEFAYNAASYTDIVNRFNKYDNVSIRRGDFYGSEDEFKNGEIDILHIDIANNGDVYEHAFEHYMQKLSPNGVCILEGGSKSRDNVYWMSKFSKPQIRPAIETETNNKRFNILVLEEHPSITLVTHRGEE